MRTWWLPWVVYGPLAALGAGWALWAHGSALHRPEPPWLPLPPATRPWAALGVGLALALVTIGATRWLVKRTRWARRLHLEFRAVLVGAPSLQLLNLAVASSLGEELLFRAAIQPSVGLVPAALLFGAVHISPRGMGLSWTLWAAVMGLALGAAYAATGNLLAPLLAHGLINYENMQYICNYDPTSLDNDPEQTTRGAAP